MPISNKSYGRKTDKETQSPMLKIFKDMQKDTLQQEKVTLLKDKRRDKKKKSYTESRSKSEPKSYDSNSTDRSKMNKQANITVQDILEDKEDYGFDRSRSDGLRGGVKETWWFRKDGKKKQDAKKDKKQTIDDTCSCVSCAIKKILGSECTCVSLLIILFSMSVVIAFLLVFRGEFSPNMKQLIKRQLPEGYGTDRNTWDRQLNSLDSVSNILDNSGTNYKTPFLNDMNAELSDDLASILDSQKIDKIPTSEKLRDFYQKLIQTDVKIKKLKHDINQYYQNDNLNTFTERFKRSLKNRFNNHHFRAFNAKKKIKRDTKKYSMKDKKRSLENRYNVTGYIVEDEKVLVKYEPERKRNFPKCAHALETKSHEKKLKHPFYKNSQRIDEMLKYKKPEIATYNLIQKDNKAITTKHKTTRMKLIDYKVYDEKQDIHTDKVKTMNTKTTAIKTFLSTAPDANYDVAHSVSTVIDPWEDRSNSKTPLSFTHDRIGYRKLMEADEEDDEELNYDIKEVLNDDQQEGDPMDRPVEIKKRETDIQPTNYKYYSPSQILNPNWKGPMPFYPDEINAMIKQAALQNSNMQLPVTTKDMKAERDKIKKDVSDREYIEDYSNNKFNKIVKMAQAYSDYGVVYNKKDDDNKEKINKPGNRFKQSLEENNLQTDFFSTTSNTDGSPSEGIRFEYRKGNVNHEHEQFMNDVTKHIKIVKHPMLYSHSTTLRPVSADLDNIFNKDFKLPSSSMEIRKPTKANRNIFFGIRKGSRSLKSIDIIDKSIDNTNISSEFNETIKSNTTNLDSMFSFLAIMGDWFRTLSYLSGETIGNFTSNNITQVNSTKSKNKRLEANSSGDVLYPSYDLDMVDNIGHRSRVLMSVTENNTDGKSYTKHKNQIDMEISNQSDSYNNIIPITLILAANTPNISKDNATSKIENITNIVKRSVDDSKLVFWNDLYDDNEYGIKLDYADKIREKHLANNRNVMQKSKDWIQGKLNNITVKVKNKIIPTDNMKTVKKTKVLTKLNPSKPKKRKIRNSNENSDISMKKSFAALNANMKRVCQQAAKAVQNPRNIEVRDDNKEGAEATSLMQQLVRLMTDLVEIQVQQKTCAKLPSDLQNFLEWLTAPAKNNNKMNVDDLTPGLPDYVAVDDGFARFDKSTKTDFLTTISEDSHQDDRTECLGTIRAVQDLIQQYEGMNDDDKSKMSGVREYLENQLSFLNKKINSNVNSFKLYEKRELRRIKKNSHEKPKKYIKNFSKKHTKTTFNDYFTENSEDTIIINKNLVNNINNDLNIKLMNSKLTKDEIKSS